MNQNQKQIKRRKKWPMVLGGFVVVIVAVVVVFSSTRPRAAAFNIQTDTVAKGSIAQTVVGTGSLEYEDETEIKLPVGIKILDVSVESGDSIAKGDVIATIDPVSLNNKIASIQSEIESLDEKINSSKDDTDEEYVRTNVTGRVKKIYTEKDDLLSDVMDEHGALMLVSIDEKMAVDITTTQSFSKGDEVNVYLENGSKKTGKVDQTTADGYTITLTDNGPKLDEQVEVQDKDGNVLGSGALYIHQPIEIVGSSGTVKTIHVSDNEKIYEDEKVLTLKQLPSTAEHQGMLLDRKELTDTLNVLLELSKTNSLIAENDGAIRSVSIADDQTTSASSTNGAAASGDATADANTSTTTSSSDDSLAMVAFTVSQSDQVILAIEVDELDILSIEMEQEAVIVFDALQDQEFTGSITKIASSPEAVGGIAKYIVEITLPKDTSMRVGMSATATVLVSQKDNIMTLPLDAIQESGNRVFVYTSKDEKTGALSGEKDIVTGVSDGKQVEIVSGLSEGDTVHYALKTTNITGGNGNGGMFGGTLRRQQDGE